MPNIAGNETYEIFFHKEKISIKVKFLIHFPKNPLGEFALEKSPEENFPLNNDPRGNFLWVLGGNLLLSFAGDSPKSTSSYFLSILTQSLLWNLKPLIVKPSSGCVREAFLRNQFRKTKTRKKLSNRLLYY